jgi:predicted DNA-binding transcriptional regulator AlpA
MNWSDDVLRTNAGRKAAEARAAQAAQKIAEREAAITATLANLPSDLGRNRILDAATASEFWGVSLAHWRRMYRIGAVPKPIKIGERKLGWRIGTLADALEARERAAAGA